METETSTLSDTVKTALTALGRELGGELDYWPSCEGERWRKRCAKGFKRPVSAALKANGLNPALHADPAVLEAIRLGGLSIGPQHPTMADIIRLAAGCKEDLSYEQAKKLLNDNRFQTNETVMQAFFWYQEHPAVAGPTDNRTLTHYFYYENAIQGSKKSGNHHAVHVLGTDDRKGFFVNHGSPSIVSRCTIEKSCNIHSIGPKSLYTIAQKEAMQTILDLRAAQIAAFDAARNAGLQQAA